NGGSIAAWYVTTDSQTMLVIHNTSKSEQKVATQDDTSHQVALLGSVMLGNGSITLAGNSSVVFKL
ncbi:MAG: hypothetical protein IJ884_03785, partial [Bacteroidales bacterium]|nr:hypothetical protein [Bacteroidales bacterium]